MKKMSALGVLLAVTVVMSVGSCGVYGGNGGLVFGPPNGGQVVFDDYDYNPAGNAH